MPSSPALHSLTSSLTTNLLPAVAHPPSLLRGRWTFSDPPETDFDSKLVAYSRHLAKVLPDIDVEEISYIPIMEGTSPCPWEVCLFYIPPAKVSGSYFPFLPLFDALRSHDTRLLCLAFSPSSQQSIPLHDHPDMLVYSTLLRGSLTVLQCEPPYFFSWLSSWASVASPAAPFSATLHAPLLSSPAKSNLHSFTAGANEGACILDVVIPGYIEGRECNYYELGESGLECLGEDSGPNVSTKRMDDVDW